MDKKGEIGQLVKHKDTGLYLLLYIPINHIYIRKQQVRNKNNMREIEWEYEWPPLLHEVLTNIQWEEV